MFMRVTWFISQIKFIVKFSLFSGVYKKKKKIKNSFCVIFVVIYWFLNYDSCKVHTRLCKGKVG